MANNNLGSATSFTIWDFLRPRDEIAAEWQMVGGCVSGISGMSLDKYLQDHVCRTPFISGANVYCDQ